MLRILSFLIMLKSKFLPLESWVMKSIIDLLEQDKLLIYQYIDESMIERNLDILFINRNQDDLLINRNRD
jgi:hypothetical protein